MGTIDIQDLRQQLLTHPLYDSLVDERSLRTFMEFHAFAVWDFLSLLKSLQRRFTCVEVPWSPVSDPVLRRLINEIVLDEESDIGPDGTPLSHFEIYLDAMHESGANPKRIQDFAALIGRGETFPDVVAKSIMPPGTREFVETTMRFTEGAPSHVLAAVFAYGREEIIPAVFQRIVERLYCESPDNWKTFRFYLERHIEKDDEIHAPLARQLVASLCWGDSFRWREAEAAARECLRARIALWDNILRAVELGKASTSSRATPAPSSSAPATP